MTNEEYIRYAFRGDVNAVKFAADLHAAVHLWDDLIDKDVEITPEAVNRTFRRMLVDLPSNPFYVMNAHLLAPVISTGISAWHAANTFEASDDREKWNQSHTLRIWMASVYVMCADIIGGGEWADHVAPEIWARTQGDALAKYIEEVEVKHA